MIPDGVTTIADYSLSGYGNLNSVIIPDSVVIIGDGAFSNCPNLSSITIPDSVINIEGYEDLLKFSE